MLYSLRKLLAKFFGPNGVADMGHTFHVFLRSGQVVELNNVTEFTLQRDNTTGQYSGYDIRFATGCVPRHCSFSVPDIVAVVSPEVI